MNDGGPAFPASQVKHHDDGEISVYRQDGMTLRDYFAAKAMLAIISQSHRWNYVQVAKHAYGYADAMLKDRKSNAD